MSARPAVAVLCCLALLLAACRGDAPEPEPEPQEEPEEIEEVEAPPEAPLTGLPTTEEILERPVLAVKIDNAPAARPQVGLDQADVVFEERIEGGAVRFIALFHSELPDTVGPVRSGRPIDVDVLGSFGHPVLAYSGARSEVASMLERAPIALVTEGAPGIYREGSRSAPHNLFVEPAEVLAVGEERGATPIGDAAVWRFDAEATSEAVVCPDDDDAQASDAPDGCPDPGAGIEVAVTPIVGSTFTFDEDDGVYHRRENDQAGPEDDPGWDNVLVLGSHHYRGGCCDTAGQPYDETELTGSDTAVLLRDGERFIGSWDKPDATSPLRLLDEDGEPLLLAPGRTWVLLPPSDVVADLR